MPNVDTIAAIATAAGRAGIGVIRVSGKNLGSFVTAICRRPLLPRLAALASFRDSHGELIDQGIALFFPAPHSYTGEDVLELQGHGGDAVLQVLLKRCVEVGARLAEPGEFTKRAYLNNKIDLAQAESVADVIDAATTEAARSAMRSLSGEFSRRVTDLVKALIDLRMLVEATLDFPEEDVDFLVAAHAYEKLDAIEASLQNVLATAKQGSLLRSGLQVVLLGRPNAGKSSLLNRLAGEDLAIVTPVPGTTRDPVRARLQIEGVPVHVVDTAGLRATQDAVEQIGVERSWQAAEQASVVLHIIDATVGFHAEDQANEARLGKGRKLLRVFNKIDLTNFPETTANKTEQPSLQVSAKTGEGITALKQALMRLAGWQPSGEGVFMARERHLLALKAAQQHLADARKNRHALELLAEELRLAQQALSSITGEFTADDLLGEIFSRFCIGK